MKTNELKAYIKHDKSDIRIEKITQQDTLLIRQRVLWPDKSIEYCMVSGDENATHFGVFYRSVLVGVASTYAFDSIVRLRKFAVENHHQGKGFGTALFSHTIRHAKLSEASIFWCDARENAVQFYEKFGLIVEGKRFYKSNLPYFKMSVQI